MGGLTRTERLVIAAIAAATVLAGIAHYADWAPLLAFAVATVALAGLAHVVSLATEQVGERFGAAATGLLQSTLGNLPELFVVIFALRAGEVVVAQTSIVGSIFANALLVLGLVIVFGARNAPDGMMRFRARLPNDTATLLLVTSFIIVLVGLAHATHEPAARHEREVSAIAAVCLLGVYLAWVVPYVRSEAAGEPRTRARAPRVRSACRSACWRRAARPRPSSRTGSSPRCGRRSTSSASRRRSPAWSSWRWPATRSRTSPASCSPARARPTSRSRSSRTRWRRSRPSSTRRSCSSRCSSPTS